MAKANMKARDRKRIKLSQKSRATRKALKDKIRSVNIPYEEKMVYVEKLTKMPRESSAIRVRNRCGICGRSRGFYRKFGLCRHCLRKMAMRGDVPGLVKASW